MTNQTVALIITQIWIAANLDSKAAKLCFAAIWFGIWLAYTLKGAA
ncbi:MAG TPA: hypothetical protein VIY48_21530 [Candidatus Paceibacterota bacterium]